MLELSVTGYDMHIELNWDTVTNADRYEVWRKAPGDNEYNLVRVTKQLRLQDWTGRDMMSEGPYNYFIKAFTVPGVLITTSDTLEGFVFEMSDDQFLDMVQRYTFRYFWEYAHPVSGMARERLGSDDVVTTGGSGFGVMSIIVGIHRGYITREEGVNRLLQIVSFLQFADKYHGAFPHWMYGNTGKTYPFSTFDNGGDLVETAFMMQGLLAARAYFDGGNESETVLRDVITELWEDVEWDHYSRNNSGVLYWHWSPEFNWQMNFPIRGYNEALIVYLLAIASPTHPVPASYWNSGWAGAGYVNGLTWYGIKLFVGPPLGGPLFFAHYSFMGFDPRDKKDAYANYFKQNTNHTLINKAWCVANPLHFEGYNENSWGLTASDDPWGYFAHAPGGSTDNGTLTPAAAIPSMPYTPNESISVLKNFYREHGQQLWGPYGFYDAFNPEVDWYADSYIAIDEGPIINMIENYRSGLLWTAFMSNPEIAPALEEIGFVEDPVATYDQQSDTYDWQVYPSISNGEIIVSLNSKDIFQNWNITLTDSYGRLINAEVEKMSDVNLHFSIHNVSSRGLVWIILQKNQMNVAAKPVWLN
ncbi:MAG TPA: glucoamylase family protein [Saprospiraceae bacterium]|nr:glucoamylase family protein [Saprospiraceae bacterium]